MNVLRHLGPPPLAREDFQLPQPFPVIPSHSLTRLGLWASDREGERPTLGSRFA